MRRSEGFTIVLGRRGSKKTGKEAAGSTIRSTFSRSALNRSANMRRNSFITFAFVWSDRFFGGGGFGRGQPQEQKGPETNMEIEVTLEDLYLGTTIDVGIGTTFACLICVYIFGRP